MADQVIKLNLEAEATIEKIILDEKRLGNLLQATLHHVGGNLHTPTLPTNVEIIPDFKDKEKLVSTIRAELKNISETFHKEILTPQIKPEGYEQITKQI